MLLDKVSQTFLRAANLLYWMAISAQTQFNVPIFNWWLLFGVEDILGHLLFWFSPCSIRDYKV
jgi:hypothetical protein